MLLTTLRTTSGLLPRIFLVPVAASGLTRASGAARPFGAAPWDWRRERGNLPAASWRGREFRASRVSLLCKWGQEMDTGLVEEVVAQAEEVVAEPEEVVAEPEAAAVTEEKAIEETGKVKEEEAIEETVKVEEEEEEEGEDRADSGSETESRRGSSEFGDAEWFQLTPTVKLVLQAGDITDWYVDGKKDAIVNAANERMLGGGGVDGAIHQAAGRELYFACKDVPWVEPGVRCPTGEAVVTDAFELPVAKVIHTVGPRYSMTRAQQLLAKAYENSVKKALDAGLKYVCFPAISCGIYGYPYAEAVEVALDSLQKHSEGLREVHFVLFEEAAQKAWFRAARERLTRLEE